MAKRKIMGGMLAGLLTFSFAAAGCASVPKEPPAPKEPPVALGLTLEESLQKYAGPRTQNWGDEKVQVYSLDPLRFDAFKAELDAGGEYAQDGNNEYTRDWEQGKTFARFAVRPDGRVQLDLCKDDNSVVEHRYKKKTRAALGPQLEASLRKHVIPQEETWGNGEKVTVYLLDPLYFEEFKVELDAGDTYYQADTRTENRDWDRGLAYARFIARADGAFELELGKEDNSRLVYNYKKVRQPGDTWEEVWDEGRITFTYLGLTDPGFVLDPDSGKDRGRLQHKGYYKMTYLDQGGYSVYIYYPETGRDARYSKPLN